MNEVEQGTWNCIRGLMLHLDPDRSGWAIDVGIGHFDFYFEWMHALSYPTLAIEPVLFPEAVDACQRAGVSLIEAALGSTHGTAMLYHAPDRDLRSLDGNLWGGMVPAQQVWTTTLPRVVDEYQINRITALKLDIEGAEPDVIATLPLLTNAQLPLIISFEWGGEHPASSEQGPWQPSQQKRVKASFQLLEKLGYRRGVLIGSGDGTILRTIDHGAMPWVFDPEDAWGNAVMTRGDVGIDTIVEYVQTMVSE